MCLHVSAEGKRAAMQQVLLLEHLYAMLLPLVHAPMASTVSTGSLRCCRWVEVEPDVCRMELDPSDSFVLVGSDGLFDVMGDQAAVDVVQVSPCPQCALKHCLSELCTWVPKRHATAGV